MDSEKPSSSQKDMYKYEAPWPVYGLGFSRTRSKPFRLAIGSFIEEYKNKVYQRFALEKSD